MSKRLVLIGEGHGEVPALPILVRKVLHQKNAHDILYADKEVIRARNPNGLIKWDRNRKVEDQAEWTKYLRRASLHRDLGGVLALFDGDADTFPAGSGKAFCAAFAAKRMAELAAESGAGKTFSLAIVFPMTEFESWIIAGAESLMKKTYSDGRSILRANARIPHPHPESAGKHWLETNCSLGYRPSRDQAELIDLVDLSVIRSKHLRSFVRFERAIDQLINACINNQFISTPTNVSSSLPPS